MKKYYYAILLLSIFNCYSQVYYPNGNIKFKGKCSPEGIYINFDKLLNYSRDEDLNIGLTSKQPNSFIGECEFYYRNGKLLFKGNFTNGQVKYYSISGEIIQIENYQKGKLNGEKIVYFQTNEDNIKTMKYLFVAGNTTKVDIFFDSFPTMDFEITGLNTGYYVNEELEEFDGKFIELTLYQNNEIIKKGYYGEKSGFVSENFDIFKNGLVYYYFKNGKKKFEGQLLNGNKNGLWIRYDDLGNVDSKINYSDNLITTYYSNGTVESTAQCKDRIRNGETIYYYENGQIKSIEKYKNGKLDN
jgi:antitoxin component YwqK of YwqJK toxin-antitoxin module